VIDADARYLEIDGGVGFAEIAGEGPAVICVHTAGQSGVQWREALAGLPPRGWRVVVPDLPGHGRSDGGPDGPVTDLGRYGAWCVELLDRLGIERAYLVGCSIGGRIVLDLAARAPERVLGAIAMAANPRADLLSERGLRRELEDSTSPSRGDRTYYGTLAAFGARIDPARAHELALRHRREDPTISSADLIGWSRHRVDLARITAPVRLVAGREDFWLDPGKLDAMGAKIPDCTTEVLDGVGHYPMEELDDFPRILDGWLEELARKRNQGGHADG
jgi:pimeloyl-ACP methyl ester carboxylesterase